VAATLSGIAATAAYLDAKYHIRHDLRSGSRSNATAKAMEFTIQKRTEDRMLVYHYLEDWAKQDLPNHVFLEFDGSLWTYKQFYLAVQRIGNWLMNDLGIEKGEVVALDGPNSASYLMLWYALEAIGACPAFINSNLTGESLQHCVKVSWNDIQQALDDRREI
jgi:acyl-CoA synthetase (AMP-forming)/AMP-acid ligase II